MKKALVLGFLMSLVSFSAKADTPLWQELTDQFAAQKHVARAVFNPSSNSTDASSTINSGIHPLNVGLPAKAIITNSYGYVATQLVDAGTAQSTASVEFYCEDNANILKSQDLTGLAVGTVFNMRQAGNSTVAVGVSNINMTDAIANPCTVTARVVGDSFSAGKLVLFLDYVVAE